MRSSHSPALMAGLYHETSTSKYRTKSDLSAIAGTCVLPHRILGVSSLRVPLATVSFVPLLAVLTPGRLAKAAPSGLSCVAVKDIAYRNQIALERSNKAGGASGYKRNTQERLRTWWRDSKEVWFAFYRRLAVGGRENGLDHKRPGPGLHCLFGPYDASSVDRMPSLNRKYMDTRGKHRVQT